MSVRVGIRSKKVTDDLNSQREGLVSVRDVQGSLESNKDRWFREVNFFTQVQSRRPTVVYET